VHWLPRFLLTLALLGFVCFTPALSKASPLGWWAYMDDPGFVYVHPGFHSRKVGKLHRFTEDGFLEVYRVLGASRRDRDGTRWLPILIPRRPRARFGWVPRDRMGPVHRTGLVLRVNRHLHRATLHQKKGRWRLVWRAPVAVGKGSTPTPRGVFWIREKIHNLRGGRLYGPWAFATSAYSVLSDWPGGGVVGIHGTNQPWLIGASVSHGCIRLRNRDVGRLVRKLKIGSALIIK